MTTTGTVLDLTRPGARVRFELPDSRGPITAMVAMVSHITGPLFDAATMEHLGWLVELELVAIDPRESGPEAIAYLGRLELGDMLQTSLGTSVVHELHAGLTWERRRTLELPELDYAVVADGVLSPQVANPRPAWREHRTGSVQLSLLYPAPPRPWKPQD
jgi:hypothetical protein